MKPSVLLIEPDPLLAKAYEQLLLHGGWAVRSVQSAQAAIYAMDELKPDVVILELQLPVHDGMEFLYELRSYHEWRDVPVIVQSYTKPEQLTAVHWTLENELGVTAVLYKPRTTLQELAAAVRAQLDGRV